MTVVSENLAIPTTTSTRSGKLRVLYSPLWLCFLLAILTRVWLIVHTHGTMAGDEMMVGLQAEHILRGDRPVYYYAQPYMGSLEAYLAAFTFLFTGPAVWAMRLQMIPMSLLMVYLAWRFAAVLADTVHLPARLKTTFMTTAALVAAFPPLYDMAEEMRVQGGYMEAFVIMLWLLLCAFRLTQRWSQQASSRELALRWAGIGFLVGLGMWIDPLIIYACAAIAIWIGAYFVLELVKRGREAPGQSRLALIEEGLLSVNAIPALLVGFLPGIIWGAQNNWANIAYIFQRGGTLSAAHLLTTAAITGLYTICLAPRAMGGALPTQQDVTTANPHIVTFGLFVVFAGLALGVASLFLAKRHPLFMRIRQLTALPLLFFLCTSIIFCISPNSAAALGGWCGPYDGAGRYVVPLVDALPFLIATLVIFPGLILQERQRSQVQQDTGGELPSTNERSDATHAGTQLSSLTKYSDNPVGADLSRPSPIYRPSRGPNDSPVFLSNSINLPQSQNADAPRILSYISFRKSPLLTALQVGLLLVLALYFAFQGIAYAQADPNYTFQATGCRSRNPTNVDPIVNYLRSEHIHYVWATGWVGDHITFETDGAIVATKIGGRIVSDDAAVMHADRASVLLLDTHNDPHPDFLQELDAKHVTYRVARFYSAPGVDAVVVTPLNRTLSPSDPAFAELFGRSFGGCLPGQTV